MNAGQQLLPATSIFTKGGGLLQKNTLRKKVKKPTDSLKYGLTATTVEKICSVFTRFPKIEMAILHGSCARGNFMTSSDIDLMLLGDALTFDLL